MKRILIILVKLLATFSLCQGATSAYDPIILDFSNPETQNNLSGFSKKNTTMVSNGIIPLKMGKREWGIALIDVPDIDLQVYPFVILNLSSYERQAIRINLKWAYEYETGESKSCKLSIITSILDTAKDNEIVIDARRSPYGVLGNAREFKISFQKINSNNSFPVLKKITFSKSNWSLFFSEKLQRLISPGKTQQPCIIVFAIFVSGLITFILMLLCKLFFFNNPLFTSQKILKIWIILLLSIWAIEANIFFVKKLELVPEILTKMQFSTDEIRSNEYGKWFDVLQEARKLIPEQADVGIVCRANLLLMRHHFANYWLYPRTVSRDGDHDYLILMEQKYISPKDIEQAVEKGYYFLGATDSANYIFSKIQPQENVLGIKISPENIRAYTNANTQKTQFVFDNDFETRWSTGLPMRQGDWFQLDLNELQQLSSLRCWHFGFWDDYPRGYRVKTSQDGIKWRLFKEVNSTHAKGYFDVRLHQELIRFIRIEQAGSHPNFFWSISEIELFRDQQGEK